MNIEKRKKALEEFYQRTSRKPVNAMINRLFNVQR